MIYRPNMSESHIPQPSAGSSAPATLVDSAADGAVGPAVSRNELPPAPSQEGVLAMGELNMVDPYLYKQMIQVANFTWSTRDEPNKLLWYMAVQPSSFNKILAHLSRIYVSWVGSVEVSFKIAGTGFHAGWLKFVHLPPSIHPTDVAGRPFEHTVHPWVAADPKELALASLVVRDIRRTHFHYARTPNEGTRVDDIGGYIACFVSQNLNTSSTGSQNIQVNVYTRLNPDFRFMWLRSPVDDIVEKQQEMPDVLKYMLDFKINYGSQFLLTSVPIPVEKILILPSTLKQLTTGVYNCFSLTGEPMSKFDTKDWQYESKHMTFKWKENSSDNTTWYLHNPTPYWSGMPGSKTWGCATGNAITQTNGCSLYVYKIDGLDYEMRVKPADPTNFGPGDEMRVFLDYTNSETWNITELV